MVCLPARGENQRTLAVRGDNRRIISYTGGQTMV